MLKRAEARAERAEKKLQDKEELIKTYDILLPILLKGVHLCREQILKLKSEFPEVQADIWQELLLEQRNGRCFHCGHVHHYLPADQDLPVAPGRTIGQKTAIMLGTLYTKGLPLNRAQEILLNEQDDQLGHSTLNGNVHDWAMQTGKVLSDAISDQLKTQSAVIMDETTSSVLQSQGRGNCGQTEDQLFRKKDYLAV